MIRRKGKKKAYGLLLVMLALFCAWIPREQATATSSGTAQEKKLSIVEIDYEEETITVISNYNDTRLYYSDAKQKSWECAYGGFGTITKVTEEGTTTKSNAYVLDISWIKKTKDYVLTLKGDVSDTVVSVTLPKQQTNFKVTLDYTTGKFNYLNYSDKNVPVYWRKNNSTTWEEVNESTYSTIQRFYARGITLYFRLGQVKGTSDAKAGSRPSKEVKLAVVKQGTAPSVTITTATQVLTLSSLLQYQVYEDGNLVKDWTTASSKKLGIPKDIAPNAYFSDSNQQETKEVKVVFRTAATEKKPASMEKTITIKAQETYPTNVKVKVASDKALSLEIREITEESAAEGEEKKVLVEGASSSNPYEYTIVAPEGTLNLETATWKTVTAGTTTISKDKAEPGSFIYVRKKAHVSSDDKTVYYPESQCYYYKVGEYRGASTVGLAGAPTANAYIKKDDQGNDIVTLEKEEGTDAEGKGLKFQIVTDTGNSDSTTDTSGGSSAIETTEVKVSSILCNNIALEYKDTNTNGTILVEITSTEKFESAALGDASYPLAITLSNGEVLNGSVMLSVLKKAYLKQECLLNVIDGATINPYTFVVVSTRTLTSEPGKYSLAAIKGVTLNAASIGFTQNPDEEKGTVEVTLDRTSLENALKALEPDKKYTLKITVADSANTEITSGVDVIYTKEAVTVAGTAWQRTKILSEDLEENLEIKMAYKTPGVSVADVTLGIGGISIVGNCYVDSEYVYVVLSKNRINEIKSTTSGIQFFTPYKIQVKFSNGAVVDTGCSITFVNR